MGFFYSQFFVTPPYPTRSFAGQTVIVTGSNVGLGLEAARHFARLGAAKVILAVRNVTAGEAARASIEASTGRRGCCEVWELDLASFASTRAFAARAAGLAQLDVVVANAAVARPGPAAFARAEGRERHVTVNVISTVLLALLLVPRLQATARARHGLGPSPHLTVVTSEVHADTAFPERHAADIFAALDDEKTADLAERYATSKLLGILAVRRIAPALAGSGIVVNLVNPGLCHSQLARDYGWGFWLLKLLLARSTEVGSRTLLAGAAADASSHGAYMSDGVVAQERLSDFVRSDEGAATEIKLWDQLKEILEGIAPGCTAVVA